MYTDIDFTKVRIRAYSRKSSEQDERQALSIESQIETANQIAKEYKITLQPEDLLSESKSAKKSRTRPVFEQLARDIESGRVQGIICWHPDRLARNAGDAGRLIDLFDEGKLHFIITKQQLFRNTPSDKFFFGMLCSQAKMENDNKGINVMRGLVKKRKMGHPPHMSKVGYKNDEGEKGYRKILPDPERIDLVRQIFRLYLTGKYTAGELYTITIEQIGLTTIQRKREGGKPIKRSQFYRMLKDPFYAGFFFGKDENGEIVRWEVSPELPLVITEDEHRKILSLFRRKNTVRGWVYTTDFPYKKFGICGDCGGSITAERKLQMICGECKYKFSLPNKTHCPKCGTEIKGQKKSTVLDYIYYHCVKKKDPSCPGGNVTEAYIKKEMQTQVIEPLAISTALKSWCLDSIGELEQREYREGRETNENWYRRLEDLDQQEARGVEGYTKGLLSEKEVSSLKFTIANERQRVRAKIGLSEGQKVDLANLNEKLDVLTEIRDIVENGTYEEKVEALSALGSNLTVKDRTVSITKSILYEAIQKGLMEAKAENPRFEPENTKANKDETDAFASVRPTLLPG